MNTTVTENNIEAVLDTRVGERFMNHIRKSFGHKFFDEFYKTFEDEDHEVKKSMADLAVLETSSHINEAMMVIASFIGEGQAIDSAYVEKVRAGKARKEAYVSDERSRIVALLACVLLFASTRTGRAIKETFDESIETHADHSRMTPEKKDIAYSLYLMTQRKRLHDDAEALLDLTRGLHQKAYYTMLDHGLSHGTLSADE